MQQRFSTVKKWLRLIWLGTMPGTLLQSDIGPASARPESGINDAARMRNVYQALIVGLVLGLVPVALANAAPLQQLPDYGSADVVFSEFAPLEGSVILNELTGGTDIVYKVTVQNNGTHLATNAVVTIDLPANLRLNPEPFGTDLNECSAINGAIESPGAAFNCSVGILAATDSNTFFVPVTIHDPAAACQAGSLAIDTANTSIFWTNTQLSTSPSGSGSSNGTNPFNAALAPVEVAVVCANDVGLQMSGPTNVMLGQPITYELTVNNNGIFPVAAGALWIDDSLPAETTGGTTISGNTGSCAFVTDGTVANRFTSTGELAAGTSCTLTLQSTVDTAADLCSDGIIFNTATVEASGGGNVHVDQAAWLSRIDCTTVSEVAHDLLVTSTASAGGEVGAGEPFTFTTFVDNLGPADASAVDLNGILFANGSFTVQEVSDSAGTCAVTPATDSTFSYNCVLPALDALQRWTLTVRAVANQPLSVNSNVRAYPDPQLDPNLVNNIASSYIGITGVTDLVVAKSVSALSQAPNTPAVGERVYWDLVVTNNGPSPVTDVVFYDRLPEAIVAETVDVSIGTASCTLGTPGDAGNPLTCALGTLESGESHIFVISGVIHPSYAAERDDFSSGDSLIAEAWVTTSSAESDLTNNRTSVALAVNAEADLVVTKTASSATAKAGQELGYTLTVRNNEGPSSAENVQLVDQLPNSMDFLSAAIVGGNGSESCAYAEANHSFNCRLGNMLPNAELSVELLLSVKADASSSPTAPTTIGNEAAATSTTAEASGSVRNESDTADVAVTAEAALSISLSASTHAPSPGEVIVYSVSVSNDGPSVASNASVLVSLPPTVLSYLNSTLTPQCVAGIGSSLTCTLGDLEPGQTLTYEISVQLADDVADGVALSSSVQVTSDTTTTPATATANGVVQGTADLHVRQSVLPGVAAQVGLPFTYTITVHNLGPSPSLAPTVVQNLAATGSFDLLSVTSDQGPCTPTSSANLSNATISCTLADPVNGTLAPGTRWTILVVMQAAELLEIASDVRVSASEPVDNVSENNFAQNLVEVVGSLLDLSTSASVVPAPQLLAGEPFTYTIFVDNLGPSDAEQVVFTHTLLADLPFTVQSISDTQNGCASVVTPVTASTVSLSCTLDQLRQFNRWSIKVVAVGDQASTIYSEARASAFGVRDANPDNDSDEVTLQIQNAADLGVTLDANTSVVRAGEALSYSLSVRNDGPSRAENVAVEQALPNSVTVSGLPANCAPAFSGEQLLVTCTLGTLSAGAETVITVPVATDVAAESGTLFSQARVSAHTIDPDANNGVAREEVTIGADADLTVTIEPSSSAVAAGETLDYLIEVTNLGPSNAAQASLLQTLPPEVTLLSATVSGQAGATCITVHLTPPTVSCELGDMLGGNSATVSVSTHVKPEVTAGTLLESEVEASSPTELVAIENFIDPATKVANSRATSAQTTVNVNAQLSITKRTSAETTSTGSVVRYSIEVTNNGPSLATNVAINDELPSQVTYLFDSLDPSCSAGTGSERLCSLGDLAPGMSKSVELTVRVKNDVTGGTQVVNRATVTSDASQPATASAALIVDSVADLSVRIFGRTDAAIQAGEVVSYTVVVDNFGPGVAQLVQVKNQITSDGRFSFSGPAFCTPTSGSAANEQSITCQIGNVNPGSQQQFIIAITADEAQNVQHRVDVSSDSTDPDSSNNSAQVAYALASASDLVVVKNGPASVTAGEHLVYRLSVNNLGPSAAQNVTVYDRLPAGVQVHSITPPAGATCRGGTPGDGADPLACGLGTLAAGESALVIVEVASGSELPSDTVLSNDAYASADTYDPNSKNDYSNHLTSVSTEASLAISANIDPNPEVIAGEALQLHLEVSNLGPSTARNVLLENTLPEGLLVREMEIANHGGRCTLLPAQPQQVLCDLDQIEPDKKVQVVIVGQVDPALASGTLLVSVAEVAGSTLESNTDDNRDTAQSTVVSQAELVLRQSVSDTTPQVGSETVFRVEVTNTGASTAREVKVIDQLPAGLSYVLSSATCDPLLSAAPQSYSCSLGDLAPGATAALEITARVAPATSCLVPLENVATAQAANAPDSASVGARVMPACMADLRIVGFSSDRAEVRADQLITHTFLVDNLGPGVAHRVVITNEITSSGRFDVVRVVADADGRHPGATCDVDSVSDVDQRLALTCNLPSALPFEVLNPFTGSGRWRVQVVLAARQAQTIGTVTTVTAADPDPDLENNVAVLQQRISDTADLEITGFTEFPTVIAGDTFIYRFEVQNRGPSPAQNVLLVNRLPAGATLQSSANSEGSCTLDKVTDANAELRCLLGRLSVGETAAVQVEVLVDPGMSENTILSTTAFVLADTYDGVPSNNAVDLLATVERNDELVILKTGTADQAVPGQPFEYEVRVINSGLSTAHRVHFVDTLPTGVDYLRTSIVGDQGDCVYTSGDHQVACARESLLPNSEWKVVIHVQLDPSLGDGSTLRNQIINNDARLSPASDLDEVTGVSGRADLSLELNTVDLSPTAGEEFVYEIAVTNDGPSVARDVLVRGLLPAGVTYVQDTLSCGPNLESCELGDLAPASRRSFRIVAQMSGDTPCGSELLASASVESATADPEPDNNAIGLTMTSSCEADLRVLHFGTGTDALTTSEEFVYRVVIDNLGPSTAHGVSLREQIVADGTFDVVDIRTDVEGNRPGATCDLNPPAQGVSGSTTINCSLSDPLEAIGPAPGQGRWTLEFTLRTADAQAIHAVATVSSVDNDPDFSNNVEKSIQSLTAVSDLSVTAFGSPNPVVAGRTVNLELTVLNEGPSTAANVLLYNRLPQGVSLFAIAPSQGSCTTGTPGSAEERLTCGLGALAAGENATVIATLKVDVDLADGSILTNDSFVLSDVADNDNSDNYAHVITAVEARSQLLVSKVGQDATAVAGETMAYALTIFNDGPSLAQNLVFSDLLPEDVALVGSRINFGAGSCLYDPVGHMVDCSLDQLAAGRLHKIIIEVLVDPNVEEGLDLINSLFWPDDPTQNFHPDSDFDEITPVETRADLAVQQSPSELRPAAGGNILYTIDVVNKGPSTARNVRLTQLLPAELLYLIDTLNCGTSLANCPLGDMEPNAERTLQVLVELDVATACDAAVSAVASVASLTPDAFTTNNEAVAGVSPQCGADLRIVAVGNPVGDVPAGEPLIYTLVVDNLGPGYAHDVAIVDELIADKPFEITGISADVQGNRPLAVCTPSGPAANRHTVACDLNQALEPFKTPLLTARSIVAAADAEGLGVATAAFGVSPGTGRWIVEIVASGDEKLDITNIAAVSSSDLDEDSDNDLAILNHGVECVTYGYPDLSLVKEALPSNSGNTFGPGQDIVYQLAYANNTLDPAPCAAIVETVPQFTYFNAFESTPGWSCLDTAPAGTRCVFDLGTVQGGESDVIDFAVTVEDNVDSQAVVTNTAQLRMATIENLPPTTRSSADVFVDPDNTGGEEVSNVPETPTSLDTANEPGRMSDWIYLPVVQ